MSRSVVADRLCPRIDNMQIENSVDNKENVFQCNGKLGHKMVRYTHGKFSSLHCFMITADIINVAFLLMSLCLRLCICCTQLIFFSCIFYFDAFIFH